MKATLRRILALLMILALSVSFVPAAYAAETDGILPEDQTTSPPETEPITEPATEPPATDPPTEPVTEPPATDPPTEPASESAATDPSQSEETIPAMPDLSEIPTGEYAISRATNAEIVGNPTTFATLFLQDAIQIPSFDHLQRKEHIPLYSVYLKNQPGYENNYYIAYCIEPGIVQDAEVNYGGNSSTLGALGSDSTVFTYLTPAQLRAMGVALLYGQMEIARRADAESVRLEKLRRWASTQLIIWEIAAGWRSATPPYTCTNDTLYDAVTPSLETKSKVWGTTFYLSNITSAYDDIEAKMAKHYTIPSFASDQKSMAPSYTMTPNSSGGYSITLTDTNNILSEYTFTNTDTITYSVNGNKLTVTVKGSVTGDLVCSPTKNIPDLETQLFWVWESGVNQRMMSLKTEPLDDPVPCYFKLKADSPASLNLVKTTEDGKNLAGWEFGIYSDSACTNLVSGPHTTDNAGKISANGLKAGTVYVKELGHTDSSIEAKYICSSTNPQKVTLTSGQTATVTFNNILAQGYGKIVKKATNGGSVSGWHFEVKNSSGKVIGTYVTDATGVITLELLPGTYTVTETDGAYKYWINDPNPTRTVTIKAKETATVTFTNQWRGQAQIVKTASNGGNVAGWHFEVKNSEGTVIGNYVTDATGIITLDLEPGTYTVTETDGKYEYWENDPNPTKTVTVKAGQTAKVTFQNQWKGKAQIVKTASNGGSVAGWHFEVKNSEDTVIGNYVTDATGVITLDLEPDTYTVTETDGKYEYWENDPNPAKTVTVKAGQTAKVTFQNQWKGKAQIVKTASNGGSVAGWHFDVTNSGGTRIGSYVTDSSGVITLDLEPGTYTIMETDGEKDYWANDPNPIRTVTVKAGQTAKVTFQNQWKGKAKIIKTATNGGKVSGWTFTIQNTNGTFAKNFTTDSSGLIVADLEPGTYKIWETAVDDPYWTCDTEVKTITVKAGQTADVTFHNQWTGKARIIKTLANPEAGTVAGWTFDISMVGANGQTDAVYLTTVTTGADGTILCDLEPGTYLISEQVEENSLWECVSGETQTISVVAGQTAEVRFLNALKPAQITVFKVDILGAPLSDAEFLLEWSEDGSSWAPVIYSDSEYVFKGACSSAEAEDGKLVSGRGGMVSFTGLYPGLHYRLTETRAPEGYQLLTTPAFEGTIGMEENLKVELNVVNAFIYELPMTGSMESTVLQGFQIAAALAILAVLLYFAKKRR